MISKVFLNNYRTIYPNFSSNRFWKQNTYHNYQFNLEKPWRPLEHVAFTPKNYSQRSWRLLRSIGKPWLFFMYKSCIAVNCSWNKRNTKCKVSWKNRLETIFWRIYFYVQWFKKNDQCTLHCMQNSLWSKDTDFFFSN